MLRYSILLLSYYFSPLLFSQTPSITIAPLNPSICAGNAITLITTTNAAPGATFLWMPGGATTPSITVSPTTNTTYTCTVTSGAFSNSSSSNVTVNALPTGTITVNGLSLTASSPNTVMYYWMNGSASQSITAFQTGSICCAISNYLGCTSTICVNYINPAIVYSIAGQDATIDCNQNTNGYQMNNASVAGHTYSWSPTTGLSNPTIANPLANPAVTTTYTLTDYDANGNTVIDQVTISVNTTPPTLNAGADQTVCEGDNVTLNASSNASTITWNNGVQNNIAFTAATPGNTIYTASAIGSNGCVATDNVLVHVNALPPVSITVNGPTTLCQVQSTTLCGPTGFSGGYSWCTGETTACITTSNPGTFCLELISPEGCHSNTAYQVINFAVLPAAYAGPDASISCVQNTSGAQLGSTAVIGNTYTWSPTTGLSNPTIANPIANPTANTTYTLTVTNAGGCSSSDPVTIFIDNTHPTLVAGQDQTVCEGQSVTLNATSDASNVTWGQIIDNGIPFVPNTVGTSTYYATAIGTNGCMTQDSVNVTVNQVPVSSIISQIDSFLYVPSLLNENYQWINCLDNSLISGANSNIYFPSVDGSYAVISNNSGCVDTATCFYFSTIGVEEMNTEQVICYPNPNNGHFSISVPSSLIGNNIEIRDINGKLLRSFFVNDEWQEINLNDLARGSYWLKIEGSKPIQIIKN